MFSIIEYAKSAQWINLYLPLISIMASYSCETLFLFSVPNFHMLPKKDTLCPSPASIRSLTECRRAADQLGLRVCTPGECHTSGFWWKRPRCYWSPNYRGLPGGRVFFTKHHILSPPISYGFHGICRGPPPIPVMPPIIGPGESLFSNELCSISSKYHLLT